MKYSEYQSLGDGGEFDFRGSVISEVDDKLVINGNIYLPLSAVSNSYQRPNEILITLEDGSSIGMLCLTKGLSLNLSTFTDNQFGAYLTEIEGAHLGHPYQLQKDYVSISTRNYNRYKSEFQASSQIWGLFSLEKVTLARPHQINPVSIVARSSVNFATPFP